MQKIYYLREQDITVIKAALNAVMEEPKLDATVKTFTMTNTIRAVDNLAETGEDALTGVQLDIICMSLDFYALDLLHAHKYEKLIDLLNTRLKLRNVMLTKLIKYYLRVM